MDDARETGAIFDPKFDSNGLLTAVIADAASGDVLMVGHMNAEAIEKTRTTRMVTFYSRSRGTLWTKGETSGHFLDLVEMRVDCDQDALLIFARPQGPTCHTGARSCFYRRLGTDSLERL